MKEMGYEFEVMTPDIDEKAIRFEDPRKLTLVLAHAKADALLARIKEPVILITSDQVVSWRGEIREKAGNKEEVERYLKSYHLAPAETVTAVVVTNTGTGKRLEGVDITKVYMSLIPEEIIAKFIEEGDAFSHSGGFSIRDPILSKYIERVEGAIDSVIGLPKNLAERLIREAGV